MTDLLSWLSLPSKITAFERAYLARMNRIALGFFWLNLPLFVAVAFFNDTNPGLAVGLTLATLLGPTVALYALDNPRHVSMAHGFTAMCMGGLLVHFGQGPVQIEMHFYFFSLLAVLAMFANPMVVLVAAVTVTLHHTVVWAIIPSSVFNYDASIWVVAIHAAFVVVESAAACFIARSFFDNVIGLERIVAQRTAALAERNDQMHLVLDNVAQGLLTVDRQLRVSAERSAVVDRWLPPGDTLDVRMEAIDAHFAAWLRLGWEAVTDGLMPLELCLDQLPARLVNGEQILRVAYRPIQVDQDGQVQSMLVVLTDITEEEAAREAEAQQQELMEIFSRFLADKTGFLEFFTEADQIVADIVGEAYGGDVTLAKRWLHTLKGNAMIFGLQRLGTYVHEVESEVVDTGAPPGPEPRRELERRWAALRGQLDRLVGTRSDGIQLTDDEYTHLMGAVHTASREALARRIRAWKLEPTRVRLDRIRAQAQGIAGRVNKPDVRIEIRTDDIRLAAPRFQQFWCSFVHIIRNALDHGIEPLAERQAAGKEGPGTLTVSAYLERDDFVVEVADDGRGLDWDKVRRKAEGLGVAADTEEDLARAIFVDGLSTRDAATQMSGRGVGLAAVRQATEQLGGTIEVSSSRGEGTTFRFRFPQAELADDVLLMADLADSALAHA